ncbi:hypothetical protein NIES4073_50250 [Kalymmatonema gypsitolerans NIES-4073]|nr:hypothetical protein NIES4073_50250 [Scytonema sp. NIES-4073]
MPTLHESAVGLGAGGLGSFVGFSTPREKSVHLKVLQVWNLWHIPDTLRLRYHQQSLTEPY